MGRGLQDEFDEQRGDPVQAGRQEYTFSRIVFACIDIEGKQHGIGQQGYTGDASDQVVLFQEHAEELPERKQGPLSEIIDHKAQYRSKES